MFPYKKNFAYTPITNNDNIITNFVNFYFIKFAEIVTQNGILTYEEIDRK